MLPEDGSATPFITGPFDERSPSFAPDGRWLAQSVVRGVESGRYHANLDRVFALDDIQEAHRYMEGNQATGKLVVALDGFAAGRLHGVSES